MPLVVALIALVALVAVVSDTLKTSLDDVDRRPLRSDADRSRQT
jgi:hypothetical protein